MREASVTWEADCYPPAGVYRLLLTDGRQIVRPMTPDWTWDDTFNGARIDAAWLVEEPRREHQ